MPKGARGAKVAYFTMEVALDDSLPTYSGGLGVLAGDHLKSAADLGLPLAGVTLLYRGGYFRQSLAPDGSQVEEEVEWSPEDLLERLETTVEIELEGRPVRVGAWRLEVTGRGGHVVPVYFLDTDVEGNDEEARRITDRLYIGDRRHRLCQEAVLGLGGVAMLRRLGHGPARYHMNEGHSALLVLQLLDEMSAARVRTAGVFTTHTPVPAGHDRFARPVVRSVLGERRTAQLESLGCLETNELNMTELGIAGSRFVNGVSRRHAEVTRELFPGVEVSSITNGIHVPTWVAPSMAALFDRHVAGWRESPRLLRYGLCLPLDELAEAHAEEKRRLLDQIVDRTGRRLDPDALTLGTARRATGYKQLPLVLSDRERLESLAGSSGPLQIVFSGKAHPNDPEGRSVVRALVEASRSLAGAVEVVFLESYDLRLAGLLVAGSDVWLNNPVKPNEASGTSGMKAAVNGVPSLSTLDGWWVEGCIESVTGWAVGSEAEGDDAADLYEALERAVLPAYYKEPGRFNAIRAAAIALNGSFFTSERMVAEYLRAAYRL